MNAAGSVTLMPSLRVLAGNHNVVAARTRDSAGMAGEAERLPALQSQDPVGGPASENSVGDSTVVHEHLVFSERQFIAAAEVNHLADIEVGQSVVELWTQARNSNRPGACRRWCRSAGRRHPTSTSNRYR